MSKQKIGQILLEHTSLTQEKLDEVLSLQKEKGMRLGEILIQKNYLTPEEVLKALSVQIGIPYITEIAPQNIETKLIAQIPINYAKQNEILPLSIEDDTAIVAISDPLNVRALDDVRVVLRKNVRPVIVSPAKIQDSINKVYERGAQNLIHDIDEDDVKDLGFDIEEPADLLDITDDEAPIIRLVNSVLFRSVKEKASDIHIEPYERELCIRLRIDGVLYDIFKPPKRLQASIISRVKIMADLNIAEKRLPQDGRIRVKIAGKDIDIRISTVPIAHGERIVMRLLDKSSILLDLPHLGFGGETLENIHATMQKKHGIFLVTGPTGSGKSTTLNACLSIINSVDKNILTVEDPIEYQLKGVGQIQVNPKIDLTFANGLRAILRQDPDIIMLGEIRDVETAQIAINASLTGHLVLSTIHTNDSAGAVARLVDMGIEPFLVSSSILAVVAQRLVRKVCLDCRRPYIPTPAEMKQLELTPELLKNSTIFNAVGCDVCGQKGYKGRSVIHELLIVDDEIKQLILKNVDGNTIKKAATQKGMKTIRDNAIEKALRGITTVEEVLRVTQVDE